MQIDALHAVHLGYGLVDFGAEFSLDGSGVWEVRLSTAVLGSTPQLRKLMGLVVVVILAGVVWEGSVDGLAGVFYGILRFEETSADCRDPELYTH